LLPKQVRYRAAPHPEIFENHNTFSSSATFEASRCAFELRAASVRTCWGRACEASKLDPGYMMPGLHLLPRRGDKPEWAATQDYWAEKDEIPAIDLYDAAFVYA